MFENEKRTAVILDRHPLWLEAVERVLVRLDFDVLAKLTSADDALSLVATRKPDLFVTGVRMDDGDRDGIAVLRQARARHPGLRGIVLSAFTGSRYVESALEAGASAYVVKSAHPDDLATAIRQSFEHSIFLAQTHPVPQVRPLQLAEPAPALTPREREILRLVAEGYSNAQLAKMLWLAEPTVKFHLSNIYRKLDVSNRTEAARQAQLHGLLAEAGQRLSVA